MPRKCTVAGSEPLYARLKGALRFGIAILICLTALDTGATLVRPLEFCPAESGIARLAPGLPNVAVGTAPAARAVFEDAGPQPVLHVLRTVSGLLAKASGQSKAVAVRIATIIGFRG